MIGRRLAEAIRPAFVRASAEVVRAVREGRGCQVVAIPEGEGELAMYYGGAVARVSRSLRKLPDKVTTVAESESVQAAVDSMLDHAPEKEAKIDMLVEVFCVPDDSGELLLVRPGSDALSGLEELLESWSERGSQCFAKHVASVVGAALASGAPPDSVSDLVSEVLAVQVMES